MEGWWRWALLSPDGVAPSRMVGASACVSLPLHHKVQKFSSGTGSPGWSRKRVVKRLWWQWLWLQTFQWEIEAAEPVTGQRVGSTLQHDGTRLERLHHLRHNLQPTSPSNYTISQPLHCIDIPHEKYHSYSPKRLSCCDLSRSVKHGNAVQTGMVDRKFSVTIC